MYRREDRAMKLSRIVSRRPKSRQPIQSALCCDNKIKSPSMLRSRTSISFYAVSLKLQTWNDTFFFKYNLHWQSDSDLRKLHPTDVHLKNSLLDDFFKKTDENTLDIINNKIYGHFYNSLNTNSFHIFRLGDFKLIQKDKKMKINRIFGNRVPTK